VYGAIEDPYCYPNSSVLRNRGGFTTADSLAHFEAIATAARFVQRIPRGPFDVRHYSAVHKHIFQDVYDWAGAFRTVRISKGGNLFCFPEHIASQMQLLFRGTPSLLEPGRADFVERAASFLSDLNALHPFREGNGRTQLTFLGALSAKAGRRFDFTMLRGWPKKE
jgi:cell filamentation protein